MTNQLHLKTSNACRWEAVLQGSGEGVEQDPLAGRLRQMQGQVAKEDGGVGSDWWLLVHLRASFHHDGVCAIRSLGLETSCRDVQEAGGLVVRGHCVQAVARWGSGMGSGGCLLICRGISNI